eukprot:m.436789 g.436789  ORF g.436789 m.436789 type:complete len:174 (+) comp21426_c0_seq32:117-638(+)
MPETRVTQLLETFTYDHANLQYHRSVTTILLNSRLGVDASTSTHARIPVSHGCVHCGNPDVSHAPAQERSGTARANLGSMLFASPRAHANATLSAELSSPGLAWTDLLRTQIEFTKSYVDASQRLLSIADSTAEQYKYTTLEDTREYIRAHSKPVITYEEALKSVLEMDGIAQ